MRLIVNQPTHIKKVNKGYILNKITIQISIGISSICVFLDLFCNLILPVFEYFNMGINKRNLDKYGNLYFEFNYFDPVFTTKNTILV
jgi:hypothetical protein